MAEMEDFSKISTHFRNFVPKPNFSKHSMIHCHSHLTHAFVWSKLPPIILYSLYRYDQLYPEYTD